MSQPITKTQPRERPSVRGRPLAETKPTVVCPFCGSGELIKKGKRRKKYETIQLYQCQRCKRRFTPLIHKHHVYPLKLILDALTLYNRFYSLEDVKELVFGSYGLRVSLQTIANWLKEFRPYLPALRLRSHLAAGYDRRKMFIETRLLHGQVYDFKFHAAKLNLLLQAESLKAHSDFRGLEQFLGQVPKTCPHELFRRNAKKKTRSSQHKDIFNLDQVEIRSKTDNTAVRNARFVLQAVAKNKLRHETLQEFMLINDSVTVAVEVPVLLTAKDLAYFKGKHFLVPLELKEREVITGHIDFVQVRNGKICILDYKPGAKKEKPIEQLTLYALALSRLTGLRLYHFKCAWFDDKNYYEFYPLPVVYKR